MKRMICIVKFELRTSSQMGMAEKINSNRGKTRISSSKLTLTANRSHDRHRLRLLLLAEKEKGEHGRDGNRQATSRRVTARVSPPATFRLRISHTWIRQGHTARNEHPRAGHLEKPLDCRLLLRTCTL